MNKDSEKVLFKDYAEILSKNEAVFRNIYKEEALIIIDKLTDAYLEKASPLEIDKIRQELNAVV